MKIIYLLPGANRCGGVKVIAEHITGLVARGYDAEVWGLSGSFNWFKQPVPHRKFINTDQLGQYLRKETPKIAVATWWETNGWLPTNLHAGVDKGFALTQDIDAVTYSNNKSPIPYKYSMVQYVTESKFIEEELRVKYGTSSVNVSIGLNHKVFKPLPSIREPLQVLTPSRTTSAGPANLKGWDVTIQVLKQLVKIEPDASVVTYGFELRSPLDFIRHSHYTSPSDRKLRELYSQASVFLATSRREGFGLPMLEAMACGLPVVCTDAGGNREFCVNNETAKVHELTDVNGMAESIKTVFNDTNEANKLTKVGIETANKYRWEKVIDNLEHLYKLK